MARVAAASNPGPRAISFSVSSAMWCPVIRTRYAINGTSGMWSDTRNIVTTVRRASACRPAAALPPRPRAERIETRLGPGQRVHAHVDAVLPGQPVPASRLPRGLVEQADRRALSGQPLPCRRALLVVVQVRIGVQRQRRTADHRRGPLQQRRGVFLIGDRRRDEVGQGDRRARRPQRRDALLVLLAQAHGPDGPPPGKNHDHEQEHEAPFPERAHASLIASVSIRAAS